MVIDTSALVAILFAEEDAPQIEAAIEEDPVRLLSAGTLLETAIVVTARYGEPGERELDLLIHKAGVEVVSVDADQAQVARAAYRRWGKGLHAAGLNFGDCFSYALSRTSGEPLLFKGQDFALTDVVRVAY